MIKLFRKVSYLLIAVSAFLWLTFGYFAPPYLDAVAQYPFFKYYEFRETIENASGVTVFEGLPHPEYQLAEYEAEKETHDFFSSAGFLFYSEPIEVSERDRAFLKTYIVDETNFHQKTSDVINLCCSYHPDFLLKWEVDEELCYTQICFGCAEMKTYNEMGDEVHCGMWLGESKFSWVLEKYYQHKLRYHKTFDPFGDAVAFIVTGLKTEDSPPSNPDLFVPQEIIQSTVIAKAPNIEQEELRFKESLWEEKRREEQRVANADFEAYVNIVDKPVLDIYVFEGLPHQMFEDDLLEQELNTKLWVSIGDYPFYDGKKRVLTKDVDALLELVTDPYQLSPYGGGKFCGGFHPDYAIQLVTETGGYYFQTCFGCGEVKIVNGNSVHTMDMSKDAVNRFREVLKRYSENRPKSNIHR